MGATKMKVCTNNVDFYNYLQSKCIEVVFYNKPLAGVKNIFFSEQRNTLVSGNAHNKERVLSGKFQQDCNEFIDLFKTGHDLIVLTGVTMLMGPKHYRYARDSYDAGVSLGLVKTRIHTSQLGEVVCPRYVQIWSNRPIELNAVSDLVYDTPIKYANGRKGQSCKDFKAFVRGGDKDVRHKMRYVPEYALYKQLYNQLIEDVK